MLKSLHSGISCCSRLAYIPTGKKKATFCQGSPRHLQVWGFTWTHRCLWLSERIQRKISKRKRHMRWSAEETRHKLPRVLSEWSHTGRAWFLQHELWPHIRKVAYQGNSLETQCPRFLFGVSHIGHLRLARTQIPDSQKESRCPASTTLFIYFRYSEHILGMVETWNSSSRMPAKG